MDRKTVRSFLVVCILFTAWLPPLTAQARELLTSFAYIGCNRIGFSAENPPPSTANVAQLKQTLADIRALPVKPDYFFFVGDLVRGLEADQGATATGQLNAWQQLVDGTGFGAAGIPMMPLPGNHEADASTEVSPGDYIEYPDSDNLKAWVAWLKDNHLARASNGPSGAVALRVDQLAEDNNQTQSYSFTDRKSGVHYILLNTDSLSTVPNPLLPGQTVASWAPLHWVERDVLRASRNDAVKRIVVLAHKPLVLDNPGPHDIVYNTAPYTLGDQLLTLLGDTPKFAGYFCAHAHEWIYTDHLGPQKNVVQVIAGNGGSELESDWNPKGGTYFGFTVVNLYDDGGVGVVSYRRPAPNPYDAPAPQPAATATPEIFFNIVGEKPHP